MARATKAQLEAENKRLTNQVGRLLSQRKQARELVVKMLDKKAELGTLGADAVHVLERREEKGDVPES